MDNKIVVTFHSNVTLEITTEKIKLDIILVQLSKLMGEPLLRLMLIMLQQIVSWEPMWEPIENPTFWYHEYRNPSFGLATKAKACKDAGLD